MMFCMFVGLYDSNQHCVDHKNSRNRNYTFYVEFCWTTPYLSLHSDVVRIIVVLGVKVVAK